jgi:response regulator RpfG family c-di-GMP phosphodiesterase
MIGCLGTEVDLTIPAKVAFPQNEDDSVWQSMKRVVGEQGDRAATSKIKVLTVDDHPLLRDGIAAVLQEEDQIVLVGEAGNGEEAKAQFRIHRPDVTLMDLQMPGMNGIDAIIEIRRQFPDARESNTST